MSGSPNPSQHRVSKKSDPKIIGRFIEELSWLLATYNDVDFKNIPKILEKSNKSVDTPSGYNQDSIELLGSLPALFMDDEIFSSNKDIAEFSLHALGVSIPRWEKKSKYELIGHIVCNAKMLDHARLKRLCNSVQKLSDQRSVERQDIKEQIKSGLSWNEVIESMIYGE